MAQNGDFELDFTPNMAGVSRESALVADGCGDWSLAISFSFILFDSI